MEHGAGSSRARKVVKKGKRPAARNTEASPTAIAPPMADYRPQIEHLNSGTLPEQIDYPFNTPCRMSSLMLETKEKLRGYAILNPIYPDLDTLRGYNLLDPVKNYFEKVGLDFTFYDHFGVYESLVHEFIYSFMPYYIVKQASETESGEVERFVHGWKFQIGNTDFGWRNEDIRRVFMIRDELVKFPSCGNDIWDTFWQEITETDCEFVGSQLASKIKSPLWKVIHRLIATTIYLRPDGGRFVTNDDYTLMCCMRAEIPIDPVIIITKALVVSKRKQGMFIGWGHIISLIATSLHFNLSKGIFLPRKFMRQEEFERRGLGKTQESSTTLPSGVEGVPRPSRGHSRVGPSSTPPASVGYEELSSMMRTLTTYTHDGFRWQRDMARWQGDMMRNIHTQLNIPGFVEPPSWPGEHGYTGPAAAAHEPGTDGMEEDSDDSE